MNFLVMVMCAAHINVADCPLPNGFKTRIVAANYNDCIHQAKAVIASMGYNPKDARIECRGK